MKVRISKAKNISNTEDECAQTWMNIPSIKPLAMRMWCWLVADRDTRGQY